MIDFRYHVVSIVAVFLALALGLFVGSTTLQSTVADSLNNQAKAVRTDNKRLEDSLGEARKQLGAAQSFGNAAEPYAVASRLSGASVAVISAPGVSNSSRSQLETTLQAAGAAVAADVRLSSAYLDPSQSAELGQLAHELDESAHTTPAGTSGVDQASQILADTLGSRDDRPVTDAAKVSSTLSAFSDGKLLSVQGDARPATLAVILTPPSDSDATAAAIQLAGADLAALAHDFDETTNGTVMAGPTIVDGAPDGVLQAIRSSESSELTDVSTVDAVDQSFGRVATVLALAEQRSGGVGRYGMAGGDRPLPSPSATS